MKELEKHNPDQIKNVRDVKKEHTLLGSFRIHRGHTIFVYKNYTLRRLNESDFKRSVVKVNPDGTIDYKKEIIVDMESFYFSALNVKNAVKILKKEGKQVNIIL